jgi:hypothetical protein
MYQLGTVKELMSQEDRRTQVDKDSLHRSRLFAALRCEYFQGIRSLQYTASNSIRLRLLHMFRQGKPGRPLEESCETLAKSQPWPCIQAGKLQEMESWLRRMIQ